MIFFLTSTNRVYSDEELNNANGILFATGVFNTTTQSHEQWLENGDLKVQAPGGSMNVTARPGTATVRLTDGQQVMIKETSQLSAPVAQNVVLPVRRDAVVLRINQTTINNDNLNAAGDNAVSLVVISGNSGNSLSEAEIAVALSGDPYVRLADISVPQNATEVVEDNVSDMRQMSKMTRAVKAGFDSVQLYALTKDPDAQLLEGGEFWYNQTDGILKFFDGTNITALQTQSFDWGYYPPDGIDDRASEFDVFIENDGEEGQYSQNVWYYQNASSGADGTRQVVQVLTMPNLDNPFFQVKLGNPTYQSDVRFEMWEVDGQGTPTAFIETLRNIPRAQAPKNGYVDLFVDPANYTPGVNYGLVFEDYSPDSFLNADDDQFLQGEVRVSNYDADAVFKGTKTGSAAIQTQTGTALTWETNLRDDQQFVMRIADRAEFEIGKLDASGKAHEVSQSFIAKSRDISSVRFLKGANNGSPTGDITASLYLADDDGNSVGQELAQGTVTEAEWNAIASNEHVPFKVEYDELIVGSKYVVVIDTDVKSDDDNYTIQFATFSLGEAAQFNTVDGWVKLGGDFFYQIQTTSISKILVLGPDGLIPEQLINLSTFEKVPSRTTFTRTAGSASETVQYAHGLGRVPTRLTFDGICPSSSYHSQSRGVWDNNGQASLWQYNWNDNSHNGGVSTSFVMRFYSGTSTNEYQQAVVVSVDDTNVTIDWSLVNSPNNSNISVLMEAS
jgi:hypothetical protein